MLMYIAKSWAITKNLWLRCYERENIESYKVLTKTRGGAEKREKDKKKEKLKDNKIENSSKYTHINNHFKYEWPKYTD